MASKEVDNRGGGWRTFPGCDEMRVGSDRGLVEAAKRATSLRRGRSARYRRLKYD